MTEAQTTDHVRGLLDRDEITWDEAFALIDERLITLPHSVRSMTGLGADFLGWTDRGYLRAGMAADIAVLDMSRVQDMATYEDPHQYSEGTVHVLVNGVFAVRDGSWTGEMPGRPLVRGGGVFANAILAGEGR